MKKKIFSCMTVAAMIAGVSSCSMEQPFSVGEGTMFISARVNSDVVVETRAEAEEDLAASAKVWIYSDEGVVRKYDGMSELPATGLKLIAGNYTVKAWAGTLTYASFDDRWFEGQEDVVIEADKSKSVEVVCKIANVVASVNYPADINEYISDYSMTVSHKGGSLTFEGNDSRKGYFIMPDDVEDLEYYMTFKSEGQEKTVTGVIPGVQAAHHYILNISAKKELGEMDGAAYIEINVDDTMVEKEDEIIISTPPAITGYGFDLNTPVAGESGTIGRKSVYVAATSAIKSLQLTDIPEFVEKDIDLLNADEVYINALKTAGIFHEVTTNDNGSQLIKVVFDDAYINALPNSEDPYIIGIAATDSNGKSVSAKLTLRVSEAPVVVAEIPAETKECYYEQTLTATIAKGGVEIAGFEYAKTGSSDWTYVGAPATRAAFNKGDSYSVTLTGLEPGSTYRYRAASGTIADGITFRSEENTFSTGTLSQFPNASFESWYTASDDAIVPAVSGVESWDCGNHGSATMGVQLTQSYTDIFHTGSQCARLRSQFVGLTGTSIGKFAAGNLFYGKYIKTDGTDGVIGFGRPMEFPKRELKPVAIRLWVKYETAAAIKSRGAGDYVPQGTNDTGHIFVALFDGPDNGDSEPGNNGKYGFVVRTKKQVRLFDKNASNVIAYGEQVYTENTPGDGLVELTIPFEYYAGKENVHPTHIAVVCTASKYGDYFQGGEGATMWVDDVEIVYGKK